MAKTEIKCIWIDLMPALPGFTNGGAKIFVYDLIKRLARFAPNTKMVLMTTDSTYEELAALEAPNVVRHLIPTNPGLPPRAWRNRITGYILRRSPPVLQKLIYKLLSPLLSVGGLRSPRAEADVIFFPFGLSYPFRGLPLVSSRSSCVAIVYDLQHLTYPEFFRAEDLAERRYCLEFHKGHALIAVISDFVRDSVIDLGHASPRTTTTIHIRLKARLADADENTARALTRRLQVTRERYFVYPANFWHHKNHEMLLVAV